MTAPSPDPLAALVGKVADAFPTSWLDPLLTGPRAITPKDGHWDGPALEMLLAALKDRVLARLKDELATALDASRVGVEWTERERDAIAKLMEDTGLTEPALLRACLRYYQADHCKRKDGETVTWSGDAQRAADFWPGLNQGEKP